MVTSNDWDGMQLLRIRQKLECLKFSMERLEAETLQSRECAWKCSSQLTRLEAMCSIEANVVSQSINSDTMQASGHALEPTL